MPIRFASILCFGAVWFSAAAIAASDWPQWRGPNRDGISTETGLLKEWPAGGPRLLWKADGLGLGYSTVSISGERIYTVGDKDGASRLIALKLADGGEIWTARVGKAAGPGGFEGPRGTPTVDGDSIFVIGQSGEIVCVEAAGGKERWRKDFSGDFGGKKPGWGFTESPLVDGNRVVCTPGGSQGTVVALDKKAGALVWQSKELTDVAHYSSLILASIGGVRQYVVLTEATVAGIAPETGKLLWRAPRQGRVAVIPTPVCEGNLIYVTSGYGVGCNLFKVTEAGGRFSAEQVYANKVMANHHGGVVKVGDFLFGYSDTKGGWTCQNFKTGEVAWETRALGKGSLMYADGRLYLRAENGPVALIDASATGFQERGRFPQPHRSEMNAWAHPVVAGGKLYLRDQDVLLCYDVAR